MSIEYSLTLASDRPLIEVAELAVREAADLQAVRGYPGLLSADLGEQFGFTVSVDAGQAGYYSAEDDGTLWQWEIGVYIDLDFQMRKDVLTELGQPSMLKAVARVLAGTVEDAALLFNSDVLLLTRVDGVVRKRSGGWWDGKDFDGLFRPASV